MRIHHIGYLVKHMDAAISEFEKLGFSLKENGFSENTPNKRGGGGITRDSIRSINISFMENGAYCVELVEPWGLESPIYGLLKKYKNCPYHICYYSDDLERKIKQLEHEGWMLFQPPETAPAIGGKKVAFLIHPAIGMIELVEEE